MVDPADEPFFGSKTMVLLCVCIGAIVVLFLVSVAVAVFTDTNVFQELGASILGISGQSGQGTYRNLKVDAPARAAFVEQQQADSSQFGPPPRPQ